MQAQENQPDPSMWANPFPRTPNVAALEKFGDYPVGYHTGTVNVSVPIFQFQLSNTLTLPISIDYHTSGIKVEELPSSVGLGWALNAGGCISREVRGIRDEEPGLGFYSFIQSHRGYEFPQVITTSDNHTLIDSVNCQSFDSEPDIFHINLLGKHYKCFLGNDGEFHSMPFSNLRISRNPLTSLNGIGAWEIIDENGNRFIFGAYRNQNACEITFNHGRFLITSWKLMAVLSAEGNELATFDYSFLEHTSPNIVHRIHKFYDPLLFKYLGDEDRLASHLGVFEQNDVRSFNIYNLDRIHLSSIGTITFHTNMSVPVDGSPLLERISFRGVSAARGYDYTFLYTGNRRKYLSSIIRHGTGGRSEKYRQFEYYAGFPDNPNSCSQDFWGYYNGAQNTNMFPVMLKSIHPQMSYGDRYPNIKAVAGNLKRIIYPTGGNTLFEYENNKIYTSAPSFELAKKELLFSAGDYGITPSDSIITGTNEYIRGSIHFALHPAGLYTISVRLVNIETAVPVFERTGVSMTDHLIPVEYTAESFPVFEYSYSIGVPAGSYQWIVNIEKVNPRMESLPVPIRIRSEYYANVMKTGYHEKTVGGLRIHKLTHSDSDGKIIEQRRFRYLDHRGICSGVGAPEPNFTRHYIECDLEGELDFLKLYIGIEEVGEVSTLHYTGSAVQYKYVTEETESGNNVFRNDYIYKIRDYKSPSILSSNFTFRAPALPYMQNEYMEGLLSKSVVHELEGGTYVPVRETLYEYMARDELPAESGFRALRVIDLFNGFGEEYPHERRFYFGTYDLVSSRVLPTRSVTRDFFGNDTITTVSEMYYSNKAYTRPTKTINYVSKSSDAVVDSFQYCHDFPQEIYNMMKKRNMIAPVIRHVRTAKGKTTVRETDYAWFLNGTDTLILPSASKTIRGNASEYTGFLQYDRFGNPLHVCLNGAENRFILWSYGGRYPVAEIIGDISFDDVCNAVATVFGKDIHALSETLIPDPDILAGGLLRSTLPLAEVRTFTYDSINGVTTITDSEGLTTEYRYDDFGRLAEVLMPYLLGGAITPKTTSTYDYQYRIP